MPDDTRDLDRRLMAFRYIEKFYGMRSQLQKISLRLQVRLAGNHLGKSLFLTG